MHGRATISAAIAAAALSVVAGGCGLAPAHDGQSDRTTASIVRDTERHRLQALLDHDLAAAEKLYASDFQLIDPLGEAVSREQYIDSGEAFAYTIWEPISPMQVRVHGDSADVRYESDLELHGSHGRYWHTELYEKHGGRWQIVWSQATAAP